MTKTGPTKVHSRINTSENTLDIRLKFCILQQMCWGSNSSKFYNFLRWSGGDHLLNWHGMTLYRYIGLCCLGLLVFSRLYASVSRWSRFNFKDIVSFQRSLVLPSSLIQAWDWHCQSANSGGVAYLFHCDAGEL